MPKMLLRYFSIEEGAKRGREQVHVLDKWNSRKSIANIRNIAAAFEFYETQMAGVPANAEAVLSDLEGEAAATLQRVIETETIGCLNQEEREWLAVFCAVLLVRTQWVRNRVADLNGELEAHIRSLGYDPDQVDGFQRMSEEDVKAMTIRLRLTERSRSCASSLPIIQQQQVSKSPNGYETEDIGTVSTTGQCWIPITGQPRAIRPRRSASV